MSCTGVSDYLDEFNLNEIYIYARLHLLHKTCWVDSTLAELDCRIQTELDCRIQTELDCRIQAELDCRIQTELDCRIQTELDSRIQLFVGGGAQRETCERGGVQLY